MSLFNLGLCPITFDLAVVEGVKWLYFEDTERSMAQLESMVIQTLFDLYRAWGLTDSIPF